nr:ABC transporter substrate-binding protein [Collinsella urealyticum]
MNIEKVDTLASKKVHMSRSVSRRTALLGTLAVAAGLMAGCANKQGAGSAATARGSRFVFGDTTFNPENEEPDINPHNTYSGWAAMRYGVGETLFRYSDAMEIQPWLATGFKMEDPKTWRITLRDGVKFSNGRDLDATAVKECLDHLIEVHDRARTNLDIESIEASGKDVIITTTTPKPTLLNSLSDPFGCIIDMQAGISSVGMVVGTGPYVATSLESGSQIDLERNKHYWDGTPGYDEIRVLTITDGDTLTMSLQSGEIDGAYGMPYASYPLFEGDDYTFSSTPTSRAFFAQMNFESPLAKDPAVRRAIALAIDKETFVNKMLKGNGYVAHGPFPENMSFGGKIKGAPAYEPKAAIAALEQAGWVDADGDGIREKDGVKLQIRWLTYPSRQELPLLAESVQATLKEVGIDVSINSTADHNTLRKDRSAWDVYASAMVTAPTGDPEYFFATHCLDSSTANNGAYHSDELEKLAAELSEEFDVEKRSKIAVKMQETILADDAYVFCSHLKMSMISSSKVKGLVAHPCDFYEISAELAPQS